jgi:hypothetical protein
MHACVSSSQQVAKAKAQASKDSKTAEAVGRLQITDQMRQAVAELTQPVAETGGRARGPGGSGKGTGPSGQQEAMSASKEEAGRLRRVMEEQASKISMVRGLCMVGVKGWQGMVGSGMVGWGMRWGQVC